jgi:ATP-dependent Clp protease adaptor protein ClpS|tara:strand:+ start:702 stop:1007 length:306 start_codon:yes stop_codon:yes gene_type:complete
MSTSIDVQIDEKIKQSALIPKKFKVVLLNDDSTPMDWVVGILVDIFKHSETTAQVLMLAVHEDGSAVAGIYTYEIAEQKSVEAINLSRDNGFPLGFKLEQE